MRRVAGYHDVRLDGIYDLVLRARGMSVLDVGCNRGMVGWELAQNGARLVHGCDNYEEGIKFARHLFCDDRGQKDSQFEVVDLTKGASSLNVFGDGGYDLILFLATYHKLRRVMDAELLSGLVKNLGSRTLKYFAWRGTDKRDENEAELHDLDRDLGAHKLKRIHTSWISKQIGCAAIWEKQS